MKIARFNRRLALPVKNTGVTKRGAPHRHACATRMDRWFVQPVSLSVCLSAGNSPVDTVNVRALCDRSDTACTDATHH